MTLDFPLKVPGCRYIVCLNVFWVLLVLYVMRTNLSIAIIAMSNTSHANFSAECPILPDQVNVTSHQPFSWNDRQQGVMLSSYFYGYICTHILASIFSVLIGARNVMLISIFGSTLFTFLIVYFSTISPEAIVVSRVLVGLFSGPLYPCVNKIMGAWAPVEERTKLLVITNTGNIVGLLVAFGIGGEIINIGQDGWKYYFYFSGAIGVVSFIFWSVFVFDNPSVHPFISKWEKEYIMKSIFPNGIPTDSKNLKNVPFLKIFTSIPVYFIGLSNFGNNFILYAFLTGHAKFLHDVFGVAPLKASLYSMIPFSVNFIFQIISAFGVHALIKLKIKSVTFWRRISGVIGFVCAACFLFPAGFLECSQMGGVIALLSISMGFIGVNQSGFFTAMVDVAPLYSDIITGISMTMGSVAGITTPLMTGLLTTIYGKKIGWRNSFMITAFVSLISGSFFFLFGSSKKQTWALGRKIMNDAKSSAKECANASKENITAPVLTLPKKLNEEKEDANEWSNTISSNQPLLP